MENLSAAAAIRQHEAAKLKKLVTTDAADETKFRIPILSYYTAHK
jgi:hypothetical protein